MRPPDRTYTHKPNKIQDACGNHTLHGRERVLYLTHLVMADLAISFCRTDRSSVLVENNREAMRSQTRSGPRILVLSGSRGGALMVNHIKSHYQDMTLAVANSV